MTVEIKKPGQPTQANCWVCKRQLLTSDSVVTIMLDDVTEILVPICNNCMRVVIKIARKLNPDVTVLDRREQR